MPAAFHSSANLGFIPFSRAAPSCAGDSFTELKQITVVVVDRELAHPIVENFDGVADTSLVLQPQPKTIDLTNAEVERTRECRRSIAFVLVSSAR
jgi:hypothetical protein